MTFLLYTFLSISGGKMSIGGMYKGFWKHQYRFEKVGFWYNLHIKKLASPRSWHAPSAEKGAAATRLTTNAKYEGSVGSGFAHCSVPLILRWGNDKQGNSEQTANAGAKLKKILISEVTIYRSMRPMIMKALKSKIYQTGCWRLNKGSKRVIELSKSKIV